MFLRLASEDSVLECGLGSQQFFPEHETLKEIKYRKIIKIHGKFRWMRDKAVYQFGKG